MDITKMWKDLLTATDYGQEIIDPTECDEVVSMLEKHRIDPNVLEGNLINLLSEGRSHIIDRPPFAKSHSIDLFTSSLTRPVGVPLWMIAGFPDVVNWLQEMQDDSKGLGSDASAQDFLRLFGIDPSLDDSVTEQELLNKKGQIRAMCYVSLIENYISSTNKQLELAVEVGSAADIYSAGALLQAIGEESNFTLIARLTAKYYVQLQKEFKDRFPTETLLIACAGVLDAGVYVHVTREIDINQIISLAEEAAKAPNQLLEFIIQLETLMLSIDTQSIAFAEVLEACRIQVEIIDRTISEVLVAQAVEDDVSQAVERFMTENKFMEFRRKLSISKG